VAALSRTTTVIPRYFTAAFIGGNLDRIQIIKGWLDAKGKLHELVNRFFPNFEEAK